MASCVGVSRDIKVRFNPDLNRFKTDKTIFICNSQNFVQLELTTKTRAVNYSGRANYSEQFMGKERHKTEPCEIT